MAQKAYYYYFMFFICFTNFSASRALKCHSCYYEDPQLDIYSDRLNVNCIRPIESDNFEVECNAGNIIQYTPTIYDQIFREKFLYKPLDDLFLNHSTDVTQIFMCLSVYSKIGEFEVWRRGCVTIPAPVTPTDGLILDQMDNFCGELKLDLQLKKSDNNEYAIGKACICPDDMCNSAKKRYVNIGSMFLVVLSSILAVLFLL